MGRLTGRVARIREALDGASPFGEEMAPPVTTSIDLRSDAAEEARRIEYARSLRGTEGAWRPEARALVTAMRRRAGSRRESIWLFRLLLTDPHGRILWNHLLPLVGSRRGRPPGWRSAEVRMLLDPAQPPLRAILEAVREDRLEAVRREMEAPLRLWVRREQALAAALTATRARLSHGLLQPGLFDRRVERAASAQDAQLDAALSQSAARRERLRASRHARWESCELALAIAFE